MKHQRMIIAGIVAVILILAVIQWWSPILLRPGDVRKQPHLHGKTISAVVAQLGNPNQTAEFPMSSCCSGEFRIELLNFYPPKDPKSANVRIREYIWDDRHSHVAVWFHQQDGEWVALDSCYWPDGIEF